MGKILRILGVVAMLGLSFGAAPAAPVVAQAPVTVSINAPDTVRPGDKFTATVNITDVQRLDATNYDVLFNPAVLRLDNVTDGNIGGVVVPVDIWNQSSPGDVIVVQNMPGVNGINGAGHLAKLWFSAIGAGGQNSNITLTNGVLSDSQAQEIPATWVGDMVLVTTATLQTITVIPANTTIPVGGALQFTARGNYSDNTTLDLTTAVTWTSDNTSVATVSPSGFVLGVVIGQARITATLGAISGSTMLNVSTKALLAITVLPENTSVPAGGSVQFSATGRYSDNSTENLTTVATWTSSNTTVATISATGLALGLSLGVTTIMATSGPMSGSTMLTVTPVIPPMLEAITVAPQNPVILVGQTVQFGAIARWSNNTTSDITTTVMWVSENMSVASISMTGLAIAIAEGQTGIRAVREGIIGTTTLSVTSFRVTVSIEAPEVVSLAGTFTATVNITQVLNLDATNYDVSFNPAVLRMDGVTSGNISGTVVPIDVAHEYTPGTVVVVQNIPGLTGATGSGYLAMLWFTVVGLPGQSSNVTLSDGVLSSTTAQPIPASWIGDTVRVATGTLQRIDVTPANPSIALGRNQPFTATGVYSDNSTADLTTAVTWTSDNTTVATIATTGLAQSRAVGQARITATLGGTSGSTILAVTPKVLETINVMPDNQSIPLGRGLQFSAIGRYSDASTANLTASVSWASDNTSVATISDSGLAQSRAIGQTRITATLAGVSDSTILTVTTKALERIEIAPDNPVILLNQSQQFTATGFYSDNSTANLTGNVNEVIIAGFAFTPATLKVAVGTTVTWRNNDSAPHTVTALDNLFNSGTLSSGASFSYTFQQSGTFQYRCNFHPSMVGSVVVGNVVSWTSDNTSVATIGVSGLAQALAAGHTRITATMGAALSDSTMLTVVTKIPPVVITDNVTDITLSSATLYGRLDSLAEYPSASVSFHWGTNPDDLDQEKTDDETMTVPGYFYAALSELSPGTTYYFRARATTSEVTVYGNELSFTTKAVVVWTVPLQATTPASGSNPNLAFGTKVNATDGLDANIDVPHAPPAPGANFDAYFQIVDDFFPQLDKDFRAPADRNQWTLKAKSQTENITLTWDASSIPSDLSAYMNTGASVIDMKAQNRVVLGFGDYSILISVGKEVSIQITLKAGWNMVSLPVVPASTAYKSVFPSALVVYTWNPATKAYSSVANLEPAKGYWVAVTSDTVATVTGVPVFSWTTSVKAGWNMAGSVLGTVSFTAPNDDPDASVLAFNYWWNPTSKSYAYGTTIEAGKGYWVAATRDASLTVSATSP
ncbi:MAG: LigC protein [Dehalococcoidales bacterium]|nr:LigC protein [Dehalococcoidales bacterium]